MENENNAALPAHPIIFLSYRSIDDDPPPENPNARYVQHLREQLNWELRRLGVPEAVVWVDRNQINFADDWSDVIMDALQKADLFIALLSRNYISSAWCDRELNVMAERIAQFNGELRKRRIFRIDKHYVPDEMVPRVLKTTQAIRFYNHDRESSGDDEFYYRGRISDKFFDAIQKLAEAIHDRLALLGVQMSRPAEQPVSRVVANGRKIFVAKPAKDMRTEYVNLVTELAQGGYCVLPDPKSDLPQSAEDSLKVVHDALQDAELSIHLLGELDGFHPDGLDEGIVPLQLQQAALESRKRPSFYRMIWAPKVVPILAFENPNVSLRDPFEVVKRFGSFMASDQIESDTPARFGQFVLQRLSGRDGNAGAGEGRAEAGRAKSKMVNVYFVEDDRAFAIEVARRLKAEGFIPLLAPDPAEGTSEEVLLSWIGQAERTALCWATAKQSAILAALSGSMITKWRAADPDRRSVWLYVGGQTSPHKEEALEFGLGESIETSVDMRAPNGARQVP